MILKDSESSSVGLLYYLKYHHLSSSEMQNPPLEISTKPLLLRQRIDQL
jgi:hypothetical protein